MKFISYRKTPTLLWIIGIVFSLNSCVTNTITSKKSKEFEKTVSRFYVFLDGKESAKLYFIGIKNVLNRYFVDNQIEAQFEIFDPLSLESQKIVDSRINEFKPEAIMTIVQVSENRTNHYESLDRLIGKGQVTGATLDIQITEGQTSKIIWHAKLDSNAGTAYNSLTETSVGCAKKIFKKLVEDKLIVEITKSKSK
jgi:hypothetical protein